MKGVCEGVVVEGGLRRESCEVQSIFIGKAWCVKQIGVNISRNILVLHVFSERRSVYVKNHLLLIFQNGVTCVEKYCFTSIQ